MIVNDFFQDFLVHDHLGLIHNRNFFHNLLYLTHDLKQPNNSLRKKIVKEEKKTIERKRKIVEEKQWKGRANENI